MRPGTDGPSQGESVSKTSRMGPSNAMDTGGLNCMQLVSLKSAVGASPSHGFHPVLPLEGTTPSVNPCSLLQVYFQSGVRKHRRLGAGFHLTEVRIK